MLSLLSSFNNIFSIYDHAASDKYTSGIKVLDVSKCKSISRLPWSMISTREVNEA